MSLLSIHNTFVNKIKLCKCYVGDTFETFDGTTKQMYTLLNYMNNIHTNIQYVYVIGRWGRERERCMAAKYWEIQKQRISSRPTW